MREARATIGAIPANVVAVAGREAEQAQRLIDDGMPYALLLDPDDQVRRAIGADQPLSRLRVVHPKGALAYWRAKRSSRFFHLTPSQARQRPGVIVLDAQLNVTWTHIGDAVGDYPPLDEVVTELRRAV